MFDKILKVEKLLLMFPKKVFKVRLTIILENTFNFFFNTLNFLFFKY